MTPLEIAKQRTEIKNCQNCADIEIIDGVAYCRKSGKLIHPYLLTDTAKCPHEVNNALSRKTEAEEAEERMTLLIRTLKNTIRLSGFELMNRIEIKDLKTGRYYR